MDPEVFAALRQEYRQGGLDEADVAATPYEQFARWLAEAHAAGIREANAMVLATASADGRPSARTVLLKDVDAHGFVFFTNYESRKGRDLTANPYACAVFAWIPIERQVIVSGPVVRLDRASSETYFHTRPRGAQLGAWASRQSAVLASRATLEQRYADVEARFPRGTDVPVPEYWGGYRLVPGTVEFWAGRSSRLHDRLRYRQDGGDWVLERLSP